LTLFPLPYCDFSIPISGSAEEAARRLSNAIEHGEPSFEESEPSLSLNQDLPRSRLRGTVFTRRFRLRRVLDSRNDFAPVVQGEFRGRADGGVEAHVTLMPPLSVCVFLLLWLSFTGFAAVPGIRKLIAGESPRIESLAPAGMFLFGLALMVGGFWPEVSRTRKLLEEVLAGFAPIAPQVQLPSYTADQKALFRSQFVRRRWIVRGISWAAALIVLAMPLYQKALPETLFGLKPGIWRFLASVALFALAGWIATLFYRCPACDRSLARRSDWKACPGCGAPFTG
jgi:hypothetical protein